MRKVQAYRNFRRTCGQQLREQKQKCTASVSCQQVPAIAAVGRYLTRCISSATTTFDHKLWSGCGKIIAGPDGIPSRSKGYSRTQGDISMSTSHCPNIRYFCVYFAEIAMSGTGKIPHTGGTWPMVPAEKMYCVKYRPLLQLLSDE